MNTNSRGNRILSIAVLLFLAASIQAAAAVVPNTAGFTQAAATTAIKGAGLAVGTVTTLVGSTVVAGEVIGEKPAAGSVVSAGSAVNLVLSAGAAPAAPVGTSVAVSKLFSVRNGTICCSPPPIGFNDVVSKIYSVRNGTIGSPSLPSGFNEAVSKIYSARNGIIGSTTLPTGFNEAVSKIYSARNGVIGSTSLPSGFNEAVSKIYSARNGTIGSVALPTGFNEAVSKLIAAGVNLPKAASIRLKNSLNYSSAVSGNAITAASAASGAALSSFDGTIFTAGETVTVAADVSTPIFLNGQFAGNDPGSDTDITFVVPENATALQVRAGAGADSGAIVERRTNKLTGSVVDANGTPIANATVHLRHAGWKAEFFTLPFPTSPEEAPSLTNLKPTAEQPVSSANLHNPLQAFGAFPVGVVSLPNFAVKLSGQFLAEKDGAYQFYVAATDGAVLSVDGTQISQVYDAKPGLEIPVSLQLSQGWHDMKLLVYSSSGSAELEFTFAPPGGTKQLIAPKLLRADSSVLATATGADGKFTITAPAWLDQVEAVAISQQQSGISATAERGSTNLGPIHLAPGTNF